MAHILLCGFKPILKLDGRIRPVIRLKGEKLYAAGHVHSVKEVAGVTVLAKCHSQQGKHNYSVSLDLNNTDHALIGGSCTCRYGASGNCKHCAAVVIYINESEDVSSTSQPQQWGQPPKTSFIDDKASIEELFGENTHPYVAGKVPTMLEPDYVINRLPELRCHINTILREVDCPYNMDNQAIDRSVAKVEEGMAELQGVLDPHIDAYHYLEVVEEYPKVLIKRKDHSKLLSQESAAYYEKNVKCQDKCLLCALTKGQSMNLRWHRERRVRITCSMAHTILRSRKAPADLVNTLLRTTSFSSEATTYGIKMESLARKEFEDKVSVQVIETGLVLHTLQPWLAGSPDGLFLSDQKPSILEIKCPFSRKDDIIIDCKFERSFVPYIKYVDGRLALVRSPKYYMQVQLLMYVCNVQSCYFFVYSSKQSIIIDIKRDDSFLCASVRALEEFYFAWLLPAFARWRRA